MSDRAWHRTALGVPVLLSAPFVAALGCATLWLGVERIPHEGFGNVFWAWVAAFSGIALIPAGLAVVVFGLTIIFDERQKP